MNIYFIKKNILISYFISPVTYIFHYGTCEPIQEQHDPQESIFYFIDLLMHFDKIKNLILVIYTTKFYNK